MNFNLIQATQKQNYSPFLLALLWASSFFGTDVFFPAEDDEEENPKTKKPEKTHELRSDDLASLLDDLDDTFNALKMPVHKNSWLSSSSVRGLKKLGVHVPTTWVWKKYADDDEPIVNNPNILPGAMSISCNVKDKDKEHDSVYPSFIFAIKHERLPFHVTKKPGTPYEFGMGYKFKNIDTFWANMWLTVDKEGKIHICDELRNETIHIPLRSSSARKAFGSYITVHTRGWKKPSLMEDPRKSDEYKYEAMKEAFCHLHDWWTARDKRWSVSVKKGQERVTFAIDKENTVSYFADRDKSLKTDSGSAKKIFHFVNEHERINRDGTVSTVKAHTRGLRDFSWGEYKCRIIAPEFDGVNPGSFFDIASVDSYSEEDLKETSKKLYTMDEFAGKIADMEDTVFRPKKSIGRRRRSTARHH